MHFRQPLFFPLLTIALLACQVSTPPGLYDVFWRWNAGASTKSTNVAPECFSVVIFYFPVAPSRYTVASLRAVFVLNSGKALPFYGLGCAKFLPWLAWSREARYTRQQTYADEKSTKKFNRHHHPLYSSNRRLPPLGRYEMFKGLLGVFDEERRNFRARLREQQLLMQDAIKDVVFLKERNEELEQRLDEAARWEADIT